MFWLFEVLERTFTPEKYKKRTAEQRAHAERIYQEFFRRQVAAGDFIQKNIRTSQLLAEVLLNKHEED
jgi:hypothetical protein